MEVSPMSRTLRTRVVAAALVAFLLPLALVSSAGAGPAAPTSYRWTTYLPNNTGIPGDYVYAIATDSRGRQWVTADDPIWGVGGLGRFDGTRWRDWTNVDRRSPTARMTSLQFGPDGVPWMGSDLGLLRLDGDRVQVAWSQANAPWPTNSVTDFDWDSTGNLWVALADVATVHGGLAKYDGSTWTVYTTANGIPWTAPWDRVTAVEIDDNDNVYIGSDVLGAARLHNGQWTWMRASGTWIGDIAIAPSGEPWFAFVTGGVASWTGGRWVDRTGPFGANGVSLITTDHAGNMWIGTFTDAIWRFHAGAWDQSYNPPSLTHVYGLAFDVHDRVTAVGIGGMDVLRDDGTWTVHTTQTESLANRWIDDVVVDGAGAAWFGTAGSGVVRFDGTQWSVFSPYNWGSEPWGLPTDGVTSLFDDGNGRLWATLAGTGIASWDGTSWQSYLAGFTVEAVAQDPAGVLWASGSGGVFRFDGTGWLPVSTPPSGEIGGLTIDAGGDVWVATITGVMRFNGSTWKVYTAENSGLPSNFVTVLAPAAGGGVWVGTDRGLASFDGRRGWTLYTEATSGLAADVITAIEPAPDGTLWVGAFDGQLWPYHGGLSHFDGTTWTTWTTSNSRLPHEQVASIAVEPSGRVWVSTASQGVSLLTPV
jgi:ligand-binding sensor domain-containing protein